jgi:hypothetical protein
MQKLSFPKPPSLGDFALDFDISYDFKGRFVFRRSLSKLCSTVVAEMPHPYLEWGIQLQLYRTYVFQGGASCSESCLSRFIGDLSGMPRLRLAT